jgi:hypothetical protein
MPPGRKLWISTSHCAAMAVATSRAACCRRSRIMLRLLRLRARKDGLAPKSRIASAVTPKVRASSPWPGSSILMMSAPRSPRICVAAGPAKIREKSNTRMPLSTLCNRPVPSSTYRHDPHRVHPGRAPQEPPLTDERLSGSCNIGGCEPRPSSGLSRYRALHFTRAQPQSSQTARCLTANGKAAKPCQVTRTTGVTFPSAAQRLR